MEDNISVLSAGDRIRNYEIQCLAGRGGMGYVYKALDTKLNRVVALKFLPPHLTFSDEARKRLLQEARSASALDHPNIGVVHGIEELPDGRSFIVMVEYLLKLGGCMVPSAIRQVPLTAKVCRIQGSAGREWWANGGQFIGASRTKVCHCLRTIGVGDDSVQMPPWLRVGSG